MTLRTAARLLWVVHLMTTGDLPLEAILTAHLEVTAIACHLMVRLFMYILKCASKSSTAGRDYYPPPPMDPYYRGGYDYAPPPMGYGGYQGQFSAFSPRTCVSNNLYWIADFYGSRGRSPPMGGAPTADDRR